MSDSISVKNEPREETTGISSSSTSTIAASSVNGALTQEGEEDEAYEDSLDLDMTKEGTKVWLVRLPKFLMDKWRDVESNSGKELGKVRICNSNPNANKKEVCKIVSCVIVH